MSFWQHRVLSNLWEPRWTLSCGAGYRVGVAEGDSPGSSRAAPGHPTRLVHRKGEDIMFQFKFKSIVKVISFTSSGVRLCESVHNYLNSKLRLHVNVPAFIWTLNITLNFLWKCSQSQSPWQLVKVFTIIWSLNSSIDLTYLVKVFTSIISLNWS